MSEMNKATSFNKLVVEAYKKEGLKPVVNNGFAMVQQKVSLKGLTVLVDAHLGDGTHVVKGSIAYIKEESLYTAPWAQKILESDTLGACLVVDMANVEYIAPPPGEVA